MALRMFDTFTSTFIMFKSRDCDHAARCAWNPAKHRISLAVIPAQQKTINQYIFRITEDYQILPICNDALFN
jgi:hypothetical protein